MTRALETSEVAAHITKLCGIIPHLRLSGFIAECGLRLCVIVQQLNVVYTSLTLGWNDLYGKEAF